MKFSLGCDPELFLFDKELGRVVPACGKVPGTKDNPHKVDGGTVQLDGTLVEIGTNPAYSADEFEHNLRSVMSEVRKIVGNRYDLVVSPLGSYHPHEIKEIPEECLQVGCSPQYKFENDVLVEIPQIQKAVDPYNVPAGGHIHVGFGVSLPVTDPLLVSTVKAFSEKAPSLDAYDVHQSRAEVQRHRLMNSLSRVIRVKPYGYEYRNPSPLWLATGQAGEIFRKYNTVFRHMQGECSPPPRCLNVWGVGLSRDRYPSVRY